MDSLVPKLLDAVPILDLSTFEQKAHIVRLLLSLCLLTDEEVQLGVAKLILLSNSTLLYKHKSDTVRSSISQHKTQNPRILKELWNQFLDAESERSS